MMSVMCCGCLRLLGKNGELIGERSFTGGVIDIQALIDHFKLLKLREQVADFESKEKCDEAALAHGWTVTDPDGSSNHRCPDCRLPESWNAAGFERRGGYIDWGEEKP